MTREQLEHVIRASADITQQYEFMILGSQAILGADPNPPPVFTVSMEADIYPLGAPHLADQIEGAIGEFSDFHITYGYYAEGIDPAVAILPSDWMPRIHKSSTRTPTGLRAIAWMNWTSAWPRPWPAATRIASSALPCCCTAT